MTLPTRKAIPRTRTTLPNPSESTPATSDVATLLTTIDRLERACRRLRGTVILLSEPQPPDVIAHVGSTCRGWVPHILNLSASLARELVALDPSQKGVKRAR